MDPSPPPSSRSWSIYGREEITQRYEVLSRIGSGAYSDVYRGRRRSDGLTVALKEVHDYQSAFREIEALQALRGAPNVVDLLEYFWQEDDDAVLVLEFLPVDLDSVIREAKRSCGGIPTGELKQWMLQILRGVDACHGNSLVHRDLKPSNLLISAEGVLKLADFGQARILQETRFISQDNNGPVAHSSENEASLRQQPSIVQQVSSWPDGPENQSAQELKPPICEDDYLQEFDSIKGKDPMDDTDNDSSLRDGDASCHATCSTADMEDDPFDGTYPCEAGVGGEAESCALTSCVGTRWFRAPELLYGSTDYGQEVDLWSLGCIFAELLSLEPLFPGTSDIEQYGRIISILGDLNEETWPGCSKLPDYSKVFFAKVENPIGLHACLPGRSAVEVDLVRRLVCYDPSNRATAMELLHDKYFNEEPLPVPVSELRVPSAKGGLDDECPTGEWGNFKDLGSDSDFEEFGRMDASTTPSEYHSTYLF